MKTVIAALGFALVAIGLYLTARFVGGYFWHPLSTGTGSTCFVKDHTGCGYSFWSGAFGDLGLITLVGGLGAFLGAWWRKHNCHVTGCWRLQWHPHPGHGHPVCVVHHPYGQGRGSHLRPEHHRDHSYWLGQIPFHPSSQNATVSSYATFNAEIGGASGYIAPEPENEKPKRVRKPGTEDVTDLDTKR